MKNSQVGTIAQRPTSAVISDAVSATTEQLLNWFSLRWQIELFFREMKSELGMCQYKFGMFERVVGWVNLSVLSFCYLEWYRWQKQKEATGKDKPFWQRLRCAAAANAPAARYRRR